MSQKGKALGLLTLTVELKSENGLPCRFMNEQNLLVVEYIEVNLWAFEVSDRASEVRHCPCEVGD